MLSSKILQNLRTGHIDICDGPSQRCWIKCLRDWFGCSSTVFQGCLLEKRLLFIS